MKYKLILLLLFSNFKTNSSFNKKVYASPSFSSLVEQTRKYFKNNGYKNSYLGKKSNKYNCWPFCRKKKRK